MDDIGVLIGIHTPEDAWVPELDCVMLPLAHEPSEKAVKENVPLPMVGTAKTVEVTIKIVV